MKRKSLVLFASILILLLAGGGTITHLLFLSHPLRISQPSFLYIDEDDDYDSVCVKLETKLHAESLAAFRFFGAVSSYPKHIHTGAYRFRTEDTPWSIFKTLRAGHQTPVRLVVPSVRTVDQLIKRVAPQIMADSAEIAQLLSDSSYCSKLGFQKETLPALFIPNTYEIYWNLNAQAFIKRMKKEYLAFWNEKRRAQAEALKLTPVEVSILASIVEEETANNAEKPMVAGLYLNRLHIGMPLQADPTIKFSLQDFGLRRILFKHLEVESPYNTYKYAGLPPGPIRIPSVVGLESVLKRTKHQYLYMCAKEDFSGTHNFAKTLGVHKVNARRYQQALNHRAIK